MYNAGNISIACNTVAIIYPAQLKATVKDIVAKLFTGVEGDVAIASDSNRKMYEAIYTRANTYIKRIDEAIGIARAQDSPLEAIMTVPPVEKRPIVVFTDLSDTLQFIGAGRLACIANSGGLRHVIVMVSTLTPSSDIRAFMSAPFVLPPCIKRVDELHPSGHMSMMERLMKEADMPETEAVGVMLPFVAHRIIKVPMSYTQMAHCAKRCASSQSSRHRCSDVEPAMFHRDDETGAATMKIGEKSRVDHGFMYPATKAPMATIDVDGRQVHLALAISSKVASVVGCLQRQVDMRKVADKTPIPFSVKMEIERIARKVSELDDDAPSSEETHRLLEDTFKLCDDDAGTCSAKLSTGVADGLGPYDTHAILVQDPMTRGVIHSVLKASKIPHVLVSSSDALGMREKIVTEAFDPSKDRALGYYMSMREKEREKRAEASDERRARRAIAKAFHRDASLGKFASVLDGNCPEGTSKVAHDVTVTVVGEQVIHGGDALQSARLAIRRSPFATEHTGIDQLMEEEMARVKAYRHAGIARDMTAPVAVVSDVTIHSSPSHLSHVHVVDGSPETHKAVARFYGASGVDPRFDVRHYVGDAHSFTLADIYGEDTPEGVEGVAEATRVAEEDKDISMCNDCDGVDPESDDEGGFDSLVDRMVHHRNPHRRQFTYTGYATITSRCTDEKDIKETRVVYEKDASGKERKFAQTKEFTKMPTRNFTRTITRKYDLVPCSLPVADFERKMDGRPPFVTKGDDCAGDFDCEKVRQLDLARTIQVAETFDEEIMFAKTMLSSASKSTFQSLREDMKKI